MGRAIYGGEKVTSDNSARPGRHSLPLTSCCFSNAHTRVCYVDFFRISAWEALGLCLIMNDLIALPLLVFEIPEDNDVLPFRWHHICVSSGEDSYYSIVVVRYSLDVYERIQYL